MASVGDTRAGHDPNQEPVGVNLNNIDDLKDWVWHFLGTYINLDYEFRVSYSTFEERLAHCKDCEYFNETKIKCTECGCNLLEKANEMIEQCPIDKWGPDFKSFSEKHFAEIAGLMPVNYVVSRVDIPPEPVQEPKQKTEEEVLQQQVKNTLNNWSKT